MTDLQTANDLWTKKVIARIPDSAKLMSIQEYPTEMLEEELARRNRVSSNCLRKIYAALAEMR